MFAIRTLYGVTFAGVGPRVCGGAPLLIKQKRSGSPPCWPPTLQRYYVANYPITNRYTILRYVRMCYLFYSKWRSRGTLYTVTHLPCRSARYTGAPSDFAPSTVEAQRFPVPPGAAMPPLSGCAHRDYAVLFIVGVESSASGQWRCTRALRKN